MKLTKYCVILTVCLVSCSDVSFSKWKFPYMYPVQQGNYINRQQLAELKIGMTKDELTFILGTPLSKFMFLDDEWQFIYQDYYNNQLIKSCAVNIKFKETIVESIESEACLK